MIKEVTKTTSISAAKVGGFGLVGMWLEGILSVSHPTLTHPAGMFTMVFTTLAHSAQKAFWAFMAARGVKDPDATQETPAPKE